MMSCDEGRALTYAIWMHGASCSAAHVKSHGELYNKCRQYFEQAEASASVSMMTTKVAQVSLLLALYEFKHMHYARAWLSHARALRSVLILRLHRLDDGTRNLTLISQRLPGKASDGTSLLETEHEEQRQTFWIAFMLDRLSNAGTDWPLTLDERQVGAT